MTEEGSRIKSEIRKTVCTEGWKHIESYIKKQIERSQSVATIDTSTDEKALSGIRVAQAKRSMFLNFLDWIKNQIGE